MREIRASTVGTCTRCTTGPIQDTQIGRSVNWPQPDSDARHGESSCVYAIKRKKKSGRPVGYGSWNDVDRADKTAEFVCQFLNCDPLDAINRSVIPPYARRQYSHIARAYDVMLCVGSLL